MENTERICIRGIIYSWTYLGKRRTGRKKKNKKKAPRTYRQTPNFQSKRFQLLFYWRTQKGEAEDDIQTSEAMLDASCICDSMMGIFALRNR